MSKPVESDCTSRVAYTRALEEYAVQIEDALRVALDAMKDFDYEKRMVAITRIEEVLK